MRNLMVMAAALACSAGVLAEGGRLGFVHEPYVPAAAPSAGAEGAFGGTSEAFGVAVARSAAQDDVDWTRRQREIALQEMWLYYRIGVGATDRGSARFENFNGSDFDADFDSPGLLVSFAIGGRYRLWADGPWSRVGMRFEVEGLFGYSEYDRNGLGAGPRAGDGDLFEYGLSANIMPDIKLGRFNLFAGGGIGGSLFTISDSSPSDYDDSRGALSLQAMAGASFELTEPVSLYAMVRYRTYSNIHFYDDTDIRMRLLDLDSASLEVGLEFRF
ncbi:MAG: outer membrane beta-barrel protein [Phycisphaerales bacterium]